MHSDDGEFSQITKLIEAATIRSVVDRVDPFESTNDALAYVKAGRAKCKVVVALR